MSTHHNRHQLNRQKRIRARNASKSSKRIPSTLEMDPISITQSEDEIDAQMTDVQWNPRPQPIKRRRRGSVPKNLFIMLVVLSCISMLLFLNTFRMIHSSRPTQLAFEDSKHIITPNVPKKKKKNKGTASRMKLKNKMADIDSKNKIDEKGTRTDNNNVPTSPHKNAVAENNNQATNQENVPANDAFELTESKYFTSLQAAAHVYKHKKTQAPFIAWVPKDEKEDKVFTIAFRTKPTTHNGVAHILEHSVLCGSKKYPSKDPFLTLKKGSLSTFLNAMTYNDRTVYPIASRNKKDFKNLMNVYLDAVFAPKCVTKEGEWVLQQEGWRYDVDGDDHLQLKGIVHSEMKGVYSSPTSLLSRSVDKFLFETNTYHYDSGGEPASIPTLTQAEFVDFYKRHYHPTNSYSFVSGTVEDINGAMEDIDSYMKQYKHEPKLKERSAIEFEKKSFTHHKYETVPYAVREIDETQGQHMFSITWLLNDKPLDPVLRLGLYVLDHLLVGTSSSPMNKRLSESGLGSSLIGEGLSTGLLQNTFSVGMKGIKGENVAKLETLILQELETVAKDGFAESEISAAVNIIEFGLREMHSSSTPAGIEIFVSFLARLNYDQNPFEMIEFEDALAKLKESINEKKSEYFAEIINSYLVKNNHRVHMELTPSISVADKLAKEEEDSIKKAEASLTPDELTALKEKSRLFKLKQETNDSQSALDSIPKLTLSDMAPAGVEYDIDVTKNAYGSSALLTKHVVHSSSGMVYLDVGFDISSMRYNDTQLLPLILSMLNENDSQSHTRHELNTMIGMHTGGISIGLELLPVLVFNAGQTDYRSNDNKKMRSILSFRGKCVAANVDHLLYLIKELAQNSLPVTKEKGIELLTRRISSFKAAMSSSGHVLAMKRMHSRYNTQSFLREKLTGIRQLEHLHMILEQANDDWEGLENRIKNAMKSFSDMYSSETIINLTADNETLTKIDKVVEKFVTSLRKEPTGTETALTRTRINVSNVEKFHEVDHPWMKEAAKERSQIATIENEWIPISSRVSYVGRGGRLFDESEHISGGNCVANQYLKTGYLWDQVRAKNGAYGVTAQLSPLDGTMLMVSYRDPQLYNTANVFQEAGNFMSAELEKKIITDQMVETAIIGCIGGIDTAALPPSQAGWLAFLRFLGGSTKVLRQNWRDEILSATVKDFETFSKRLQNWKNASISVFASESAIDEIKSKLEIKSWSEPSSSGKGSNHTVIKVAQEASVTADK